MQQVLTEQQFYAGLWQELRGMQEGISSISHLTSLRNTLLQHATAPGLKSKFIT